MVQDCKVCLAQHDEEIHAATNRVLDWFGARVNRYLREAANEPPPPEGDPDFIAA